MILRILVLVCYVVSQYEARVCVDDKQGSCIIPDGGWCFHNKTNGAFNCDSEMFCEKQMKWLNKTNSTGCFKTGHDTLCCCNESDGCNVAFVQVAPAFVNTQKCYHARESPDGMMRLLKDCDDPWCYTMFTYRIDGGLPRLEYGCQSRALVKHDTFKKQDQKYHNNTAWHATEVLSDRPRCADFVPYSEKFGVNGGCIDYDFMRGPESLRGRLCCCRGDRRCNQNFTMGYDGIEETDFKEMIKKRNLANSDTALGITLQILLIITAGLLSRS